MSHAPRRLLASLLLFGLCVLSVPGQQPARSPRLEPVAETRLLMEGLAHANYRGLERQLKERPTEQQGWTFARGQALILAETGNLLMLRPPKGQGQQRWFDLSMELRDQATQLARVLAAKDYERSRALFVGLANTCNRCHTAFRVPSEIAPFSSTPTSAQDFSSRNE